MLIFFSIIGGPSVADVTDFEKAPLGFGQNYTDPKKANPICTVKVSKNYFIAFLEKLENYPQDDTSKIFCLYTYIFNNQ